MKQKIIKIGNSAGIILPQKLQTELGVKVGDNLAVEYN
jgi:antitoxin component of MazEF toxin-antitoxin module